MSRCLLTLIGGVLAAVTLVACGGGNGQTGAPDDTDSGAPGAGADVEVTGTDGLMFEPAELSAPAGEIVVALTSGDAVGHTFVIEQGDELVVEAAPGETATGVVTLEPGSYTFYCNIPGHREAGMVGTLEVEG